MVKREDNKDRNQAIRQMDNSFAAADGHEQYGYDSTAIVDAIMDAVKAEIREEMGLSGEG